jgi:hypothetical protein
MELLLLLTSDLSSLLTESDVMEFSDAELDGANCTKYTVFGNAAVADKLIAFANISGHPYNFITVQALGTNFDTAPVVWLLLSYPLPHTYSYSSLKKKLERDSLTIKSLIE